MGFQTNKLPNGLHECGIGLFSIEFPQMFSYGGLISGKNELWADIGERLEDKPAIGQRGMGKSQDVFVDCDLFKVEDIEVENSGSISLGDCDAPDMVFDSLCRFEEIMRLTDEIDLNDGIEKITRFRRAVDRFALINPGLF